MRASERFLVIFWVVLIVLAVVAIYHFRAVLEAAGPVFAAVVSGCALIAGGILTHLTTELRAQDQERRARMEANYKIILGQLAPLIRSKKASDEFMTVHLETCIVGSQDVIRSMESLIGTAPKGISTRQLEELLNAMRQDLGLSTVNTEPGILFPKPAPVGSINP